MHELLLRKLDKLEKLARGGRLDRFLYQPFKYLHAVLLVRLYYSITKQPVEVKGRTFFGSHMKLLLPAATDIYLTGGKSHNSETRLARLMIRSIKEGDQVLDAGAHYGYFSLLAAMLAGDDGTICSFEPAPGSFAILKKNTQDISTIQSFQMLLGEDEGEKTLHEFPNRYSEYNTSNIEQFRQQEWFHHVALQTRLVPSVSIDYLVKTNSFHPVFIKIDVEGAELDVLKGAKHYLVNAAPLIAMEYVSKERKNESHQQATEWLRSLNYTSHIITADGLLSVIADINTYLDQSGLESDNIVFLKSSWLNQGNY